MEGVSITKRRNGLSRLRLGGSAKFIVSHWGLLLRTTRSDIRQRFAGSLLGLGWIVLAPGLILAIYAVTYIQIFQVRAPSLTESEYVLFIFCGLVPLLSTAEAFGLSLGGIVSNKAVLANTVFPIDLAPVAGVLVAQCTMAVGLAVILVVGAFLGLISATAPLALVVWALLVLALVGLGWLIALLNVLVRDLQQMITMVVMILLIASPIAYTPEQVPERLQPLVDLNPFAYYVQAFQDVLVFGVVPPLSDWIGLVVISFGWFALGSWLFDRLKLVVVDYV